MNTKNIHELTSHLCQALDQNYDVVNMGAVMLVISTLEGTTITKEQLETTRLAKFINHLRRRTKDDHLARRAKSLLKKWREMVGIQQQPQVIDTTPINLSAALPSGSGYSTSLSQQQRFRSQSISPSASSIHFEQHHSNSNSSQTIPASTILSEHIQHATSVSTHSLTPIAESANPVTHYNKKRFGTCQNQNETHIISKQPTSFENVLIGFGVTDNNLSITSDSSRFCSKLSQSAQQHVIPSDNTGAFIIDQSSNSNSQMSLILPSSNRPPVLAPIVIDIQDSNSGSDLSASVLNATLNSKMPLCDPGRAQNVSLASSLSIPGLQSQFPSKSKKIKKEKKRKDKSQYSVHETEVTSNAKDTTVLVDETSSNQNCRLLSEENSDKYSPFVNDEKSRLAYPEILSLLDNSSMSSMFPPESSPNPVDEQSKVNLSANDSLRTTFNLSLSDLSFAGKFKQGAALFPTSNELTGYKSHRPASIQTGPTHSKFTPFRGARSNSNDSNSQVSQPDLIEVISSDKMQGFQTQAKQGTLNLQYKTASTSSMSQQPVAATVTTAQQTKSIIQIETSGPGISRVCVAPEQKIPRKRGRKKGSKGVDSIIAKETSLSSQILMTTLGTGGKKVKTTKELYVEMQNRKLGITSTLSSPTLIGLQAQQQLQVSRPTSSCSDEVARHIRKCCASGIKYAANQNNCDKNDYEVYEIPPLWLGLCHSTYSVCCSQKLEEQYCVAGRLAALRGSRCDEQYNITEYGDCCRACQVGLAVKASSNDCDNTLFTYFNKIETYHICCDGNRTNYDYASAIIIDDKDSEYMEEEKQVKTEASHLNGAVEKIDKRKELIGNSSDGTIVLREDDDDICGKVKNLCAHICENTKEAYRCKCNPGYKLEENNVTCSRVINDANGKNNATDERSQDVEIAATDEDDNVANKEIRSNIIKVGPLECYNGFEYDYVNGKCIDVDECANKLDNCKSYQYCHNTIGGFHCLNVNSKKCDPDKEKCEECSAGYHYKNKSCVDIDECDIDEYACDSSQMCVNDIGGYRCDCKIGFNLDAITNACVDINECSINNHNCLPTQRCDNTYGSYVCVRLQSCGTGYTLSAETGNCDDDDECDLGIHNCPADYECHNTKGSFRCYRRILSTKRTSKGPLSTNVTSKILPAIYLSNLYHRNGTSYSFPGHYVSQQTQSRNSFREEAPRYTSISDTSNNQLPPCQVGLHRNQLGACVDFNECVLTNPCSPHQRCINTNGSYRCQNLLQCSAGYKSTPDGAQCIDIDECEAGDHQCVENQICINRNGGYICSCPPGLQLSRMRNNVSRCRDINECDQGQTSVCPSNAQCLNTIGSYYCECKSGFQKSKGNQHICLDVDECQEIPGLCQQKCVNYWGGYRCTCNQGFELSTDNRTCKDVDECEVHKAYKLCMGFCYNVAGSYGCSCPRGYTLDLDRTTCRDIDECAVSGFCTGQNDVCTNIHGSYKCTTIHCQYGYINDLDQKNRCRLISNICKGNECYSKPSAYTYNFITLVSNLMIPPEGRIIFSLRGPLWYDDIDFDFKIIKIQAAANIEKASDNHFDTVKNKYEVHLQLKRCLEGPQDIELDLSMTVFTNGVPRGKSIAKIFILVSQYSF